MRDILMSKKEVHIFRHAMNVIEGKLSIKELSILIGKSYRQSQRIIKKVAEKKELGVIHGNTGRTPHNKTSRELLDEVIELKKGDYSDFNLLHFKEEIKNREGIDISYSSLYREARKKDLIKYRRRCRKVVHKTRARMPQEGMMIQFDGSEHQWFGNFTCDLIAGIDDATGKIVGAEFFIGETSLHSMKVMQHIVTENGFPEAFYMDEAAIFGKRDRDWNSQIKRALEELGIKLIFAGSAQAKGRVERLFRTLQDRLISELNFVQVENIVQANEYLQNIFISKFNEQFSHPPRNKQSGYRKNEHSNLDIIFCRKEKRKVTSGNTFSFRGKKYLLKENKDYRFRTININTHQDLSTSYDINGKQVNVELFEDKGATQENAA